MLSVRSVLNHLSNELPAVSRLPGFLENRLFQENRAHRPVFYVSEGQNWTIDLEGKYVDDSCKQRGINIDRTTNARFLTDSIIHFGSLWTFAAKFCQVNPKKNKTVATIFHGNFDLDGTFDSALNYFLENHKNLSKVVVSNTLMKNRMLGWGIPETKLSLIPIGVDLKLFQPVSPETKTRLRKKWGVPDGALCLGSFQKDGSGWGEGMDPKWIKGPEIFIEVCRRLAEKYPVFCLLSGPSRGFMKAGLKEKGIPFKHVFLEDYKEVAELYQCLDLSIVTSREEGGPKSIMESMGVGVPVVSTRVGMAVDLIEPGKSGFLTAIDDVEALIQDSEKLLNDKGLYENFKTEGFQRVLPYDWSRIPDLYERLYKDLGA